MPTYDTLIRGGTVIDGLRTPRYTADVAIANGRIAGIGRIDPASARTVIDADGLIVAPGFVDLHTHYDSQVYWDPYCTISGWHGVTTAVIGNCGFGFAPVKPQDRDRAMLTMSRNEAVPLECMQAGMPWDWETYPEFLDSLERTTKGINLLSYMPLNPLMMYVMGVDAAKQRPATADEMAAMQHLMREGLAAGGCGWSAQLGTTGEVQRDYDGSLMITNTMAEADLLAFARVLREAGRGFIQCIGASWQITEQLAAASGRPVIWNVLAQFTDQHGVAMPAYRDTMAWLEEVNRRGLRVFGQALTTENDFQFTFEDWNLFDNNDAWREATLGTVQERAGKFRDPARRARLKAEFDRTRGAGVVFALDKLTIAEVHNDKLKHVEGWTVGEVAAQRGCHPIDALLDIALEDDMKALFATEPRPLDMQAMGEMINSPFALPGVSDGGAHTKFITLGRYPTEFLTLLVRDNGLMDLEQGHWRLSAYPALAAGVQDRGWLREGAPADLVVYELDRLGTGTPERAWDFPAGAWRLVRKPEGYRYILVNGQVTFRDNVCTGAVPGRLLRHGRAGD